MRANSCPSCSGSLRPDRRPVRKCDDIYAIRFSFRSNSFLIFGMHGSMVYLRHVPRTISCHPTPSWFGLSLGNHVLSCTLTHHHIPKLSRSRGFDPETASAWEQNKYISPLKILIKKYSVFIFCVLKSVPPQNQHCSLPCSN